MRRIILPIIASILILGGLGFTDTFADHKPDHSSSAGGVPDLQTQIDDVNLRVDNIEPDPRVDSFFDVFFDVESYSVDSFFDVFTELQTSTARSDSFFDVFFDVESYTVDSFFDVFTELHTADSTEQTARIAADESLQSHIDTEILALNLHDRYTDQEAISAVGLHTPSTDTDPTNELQTLSLSGQDLSISGGNTVTLPVDSGGSIDWLSLSNIPLDFADGIDDDTQYNGDDFALSDQNCLFGGTFVKGIKSDGTLDCVPEKKGILHFNSGIQISENPSFIGQGRVWSSAEPAELIIPELIGVFNLYADVRTASGASANINTEFIVTINGLETILKCTAQSTGSSTTCSSTNIGLTYQPGDRLTIKIKDSSSTPVITRASVMTRTS